MVHEYYPQRCLNYLMGCKMSATLVAMSKDKKPAARSTDRHKPATMVRLRPRIATAAKAHAESDLDTDLTQFVNDAVREALERAGKWTPGSPG